MQNPFQYTGIVHRDNFCNRRRELGELKRVMENGENLFLFSERRLGKTSLVRLALDDLPARRFLTAYVDLWPTDDELGFARATARALAASMSTTADKLLRTARSFFSRLAPTITLDSEGKPQVSFGVDRAADPEPHLEEVLAAPEKMARQSKRRVVLVFDEFQQIAAYGSDRVERLLRSASQNHPSVSYIFLGSRKHLIQQFFLDKSRPLYRSAGHYPLGSIDVDHWLPFIRKRFASAQKRISDEQIRSICQRTQGHPYYTQHLCHALWERYDEIDAEAVQRGVDILLARESYAYTTLWETLTQSSQRLLRGLALAPGPVKPFSADFIQTYQLGSPSTIQRALDQLVERDVIERENGTWIIVDRFFRLWIQQLETP